MRNPSEVKNGLAQATPRFTRKTNAAKKWMRSNKVATSNTAQWAQSVHTSQHWKRRRWQYVEYERSLNLLCRITTRKNAGFHQMVRSSNQFTQNSVNLIDGIYRTVFLCKSKPVDTAATKFIALDMFVWRHQLQRGRCSKFVARCQSGLNYRASYTFAWKLMWEYLQNICKPRTSRCIFEHPVIGQLFWWPVLFFHSFRDTGEWFDASQFERFD